MSQKTCYHSELVKNSPIEAVITCDKPQTSKFKGQPDYISMKIDGEERYYPCENAECEETLSGWKGQTVEIEATGRGDDASISVRALSGNRERERDPEPRREERGRRQEPAQRRQPADPDRQETPEEREARELKAFKRAAVFGARCAVLLEMCMRYAIKLNDQHLRAFAGPSSSEDIRALAVTLFIEMKGMTDINQLPTAFIELKKPAPKQQERQPEPKREEPPPERKQEEKRFAQEDDSDIPF
jgi:hypothetical protein